MKHLVLFLLFTLASYMAGAQAKDTSEFNGVFTRVEVPPSFPGGEKAFADYVAETLSPKALRKSGVPRGYYTVAVQFMVDKEGKLSHVKAITQEGYGLEQLVVRLLEQGPLWVPAKQNGFIVKAYHLQKVTLSAK